MRPGDAGGDPMWRETDPFAGSAFMLAVLFLLCPTVSGLQAPAFLHPSVSGLCRALAIQVAASSLIAIMMAVSLARLRRRPERWKGAGLLIAAAVIWLLNLAMFLIVFIAAVRGK